MNQDFHIFTRDFIKRAHPKSLFSVEVYPGIIATFGEPKSKFKSKRYKLTQLKINKELYESKHAEAFWKRFHIKYIYHKYKGKKLPYIHRVIGSPRKLICGGYIIICEPTLDERESFCHQQSYEYWLNKFDLNSPISNDEHTLRKAIPVLLNKIAANPAILKNMPTTHWRVFEEIVAEVFRGFGYKVVLTKKTKDGGKDVIALQKDENGKVRVGTTGYGSRGLQVFYPISPRHMLFFYDPPYYYLKFNEKVICVVHKQKDVRRINGLQILNCKSNVYYKDENLVKDLNIQHLELSKKRSEERTVVEVVARQKIGHQERELIRGSSKELMYALDKLSFLRIRKDANPTPGVRDYRAIEIHKEFLDNVMKNKEKKKAA